MLKKIIKTLIKKYNIFLDKINNADIAVIKNNGITNITCLNSSYKFTLNKIKKKIISKVDKIIGATTKELLVELKKIFSLNINNVRPKRIISGNLKISHIGK